MRSSSVIVCFGLLVSLFVCIAHVLYIFFSNEKRNPKKLNIAFKIVNLSKM